MGRTARRLPLQYRLPLGTMARGAKQFAGGLRDFARAGLAPLSPALTTANRIGGHQFDLDGQDVVFGPGDWFINLGASWDTQYAPEFLEKLRADGARFALIAYDLIPELFPNGATRWWCANSGSGCAMSCRRRI